MKTHIVFVLDRSGSMNGLEDDVIGGFNSFIREQKKLTGEATLTTILFDDRYEILHNAVPVKKVKDITEKEYYTRGMTALLDAVGKAISTVKSIIDEEDNVIFVINTDGYENASREYTKEEIKAKIEKLEGKHWKFVYIGANVNSFAEAGAIGIATSANYTSNSAGIRSVYTTTTNMVTQYRASGGTDVGEENLSKLV